MKIGTTEKLKFKKLQRRLKLPLWQAVGLLEAFWKMAYRNAPAGDIGRLSNDDIAAAIEWDDDADNLVNALTETGWMDADPVHRLLIHDWENECEAWLRGNFHQHGKSFAKPNTPLPPDGPPEVAKQSVKQPVNQPIKHDVKQGGNGLLLPIPYLPTPSPASAAASNRAAAAVGDLEWESAKPIAKRLRETLHPKRPMLSRDDWLWIARVAVLGVRYGPDWIEPAFEAMKRPNVNSPVGLMASVLDDECQRLDTRLTRELAKIDIPEDLLPCHARKTTTAL